SGLVDELDRAARIRGAVDDDESPQRATTRPRPSTPTLGSPIVRAPEGPTCRADPHVPDELRRIARSDVPLPEATGNSTAARPAAFAAYSGRPEPAGLPSSGRGGAKAPPDPQRL